MLKWVIVSIIGLVGIALIITGSVLGWTVFPDMVHDQIIDNVKLVNGTDQWDRFVKLPIAIQFKTYIFEVINPDEAMLGEKIKVREKGPYIYKQTRAKQDVQLVDNDTRIQYYEDQYYEFDQEASGDLKEDDTVTILNPALNGAMQIFERDFNGLLKTLDKFYKEMFGSETLFTTATVRDILFNGYRTCDPAVIPKNPAAKLLCNGFLKKIDGIKIMRPDPYDKKTILFSFFHHKYYANDGEYLVNSGIESVDDLGAIEEWNHATSTKYWETNSICNVVKGRDSTIYPPFIDKDQIIDIFNTDICRAVQLKYQKDIEFRDVTANRFAIDKSTLGAPRNYDYNECYKTNPSSNIENITGDILDGLMDLNSCYGAPTILSFPHFLWADPQYQNSVEGCVPNEEKHLTFVDLEPNTGTPLRGHKRVQFNMIVRPVDKMTVTQNFTSIIVPLIWVDESVEVDDELYGILYDSYISKTYLITGVTWGLIGIGIAVVIIIIGTSIWMKMNRKRTTV